MDWSQRSAGHSSKGERSAGGSSEGGGPLVIQADLSAPPCVSSGRRTTSQKGSPTKKKDTCELRVIVFLLHTNVTLEESKYKLNLYIYTSPSLFVQRFNIRQNISSSHEFLRWLSSRPHQAMFFSSSFMLHIKHFIPLFLYPLFYFQVGMYITNHQFFLHFFCSSGINFHF